MMMLRAIKVLINLLAVLCYLIVGAYVFVSAPVVAGYHPVIVLSGSMEPAFPVGSVLYYKHRDFPAIKTGDAITFVAGDNQAFVTHRVYKINQISETFVTKGDANQTPDPQTVSYKNVSGVVAPYKLPYMGYYVGYLNSHLYLILIIALILLAKIGLSYVPVPKPKQQI